MAQNDETMTLERLGVLLDAYGAVPSRWPAAERAASEALVARSAAARALWEEAAALDGLLDSLPPDRPSPALARRVLETAPRPRLRRRVLVAAIPLAAAAAIALWLVRHEPPASRVAGVTEAQRIVVGEYTSPTDVLLEPYGVDVYATVPSIGCADSTLGCPKPDQAGGSFSERQPGRFRA